MDEYCPTDIGLLNQTATTIELSWSVSTHLLSVIDHFDIRYHPVADSKWRTVETDNNKNAFAITELKSETQYEFKVRSVLRDGNDSPFSESTVFKTMASLTEKMKKSGKKLSGPNIPTLYTVPLEEVASRNKRKTRKIKLKTSTYDLYNSNGHACEIKSWYHMRWYLKVHFKSRRGGQVTTLTVSF